MSRGAEERGPFLGPAAPPAAAAAQTDQAIASSRQLAISFDVGAMDSAKTLFYEARP